MMQPEKKDALSIVSTYILVVGLIMGFVVYILSLIS